MGEGSIIAVDPVAFTQQLSCLLDLMIKLGGKDAGLPFMAILDAKSGKMIVNSLQKAGEPRTNTGYPAAPEEVGHFVKMLQKGAPKIGDGSVKKVEAWLTANAPK